MEKNPVVPERPTQSISVEDTFEEKFELFLDRDPTLLVFAR